MAACLGFKSKRWPALLSLVVVADCQSLPENIWEFSGVEILAGLRAQEFTLTDYSEAVLRRRDDYSYLNAFITDSQDERVREQVRILDFLLQNSPDECGDLCGIPISIKDNINSRDFPTSAGTEGLQDWVPPFDAPTLSKVMDADAIILGKSNMHELAFGTSSVNGFFGPVRNPYDPNRIAGGSSGGTAAAIGARITPFGLGTDTSASVRNPCSLCGCVGFRPTFGRYDSSSVVPLASSLDTVGPMGISVADVILLDKALLRTKECSPTTTRFRVPKSLEEARIGIPRQYYYEELDPEISEVVQNALNLLEEGGAQLIEVDIPDIYDLASAACQVDGDIIYYEILRDLAIYLSTHGSYKSILDVVNNVANDRVRNILFNQISQNVTLRVSTEQYISSRVTQRERFQTAYQQYFNDNQLDVMLYPTTNQLAFLIDTAPDVDQRNTNLASNTLLPALNVPAGLTRSGLPTGLEFTGPSGADEVVLAIGNMFDQLRPRLPSPPLLKDMLTSTND